jgi:hypothetical protein
MMWDVALQLNDDLAMCRAWLQLLVYMSCAVQMSIRLTLSGCEAVAAQGMCAHMCYGR